MFFGGTYLLSFQLFRNKIADYFFNLSNVFFFGHIAGYREDLDIKGFR